MKSSPSHRRVIAPVLPYLGWLRKKLGLLATIVLLPLTAAAQTVNQPLKALPVYDIAQLSTLGESLQFPEVARALDETFFALAAQGLLNRNTPQLFARGNGRAEFWLNYAMREGEILSSFTRGELMRSPEELLARFPSAFAGAVVWDQNVPATMLVAFTAAGARSLAPVRFDPSPGSLYSRMIGSGRIPVLLWLVNSDGSKKFTGKGTIPFTSEMSSGSAKCDAYIAAKYLFLDTKQCDPGRVAFGPDGYWLTHPSSRKEYPFNKLWRDLDFLVGERAFFLDLCQVPNFIPRDDPGQRVGTDYRILTRILAKAAMLRPQNVPGKARGFPPFRLVKYGIEDDAVNENDAAHREWQMVEIATAHNLFGMDGMHWGSNCSVLRFGQLAKHYANPNPIPDLSSLRRNGFVDASGRVRPFYYVVVIPGDYDGDRVYSHLPGYWLEQERGIGIAAEGIPPIPLAWSITTSLSDRIPQVIDMVFSSQSPFDFMIGGLSGDIGYIIPWRLEAPRGHNSNLPSAVALWRALAEKAADQFDLPICGMIVTGNRASMALATWRAYESAKPWGGFTQHPPQYPELSTSNWVQALNPGEPGKPPLASVLLPLTTQITNKPRFLALRTTWLGPTDLYRDAEAVRRLRSQVRFVDPYSFLLLKRIAD